LHLARTALLFTLLCLLQAKLPAFVYRNSTPPANNQALAALALGQKLERLGRCSEALFSFELAARTASQMRDGSLEARALVSLATCQMQLFQYRKSVRTAEQARQIALAAQDFQTAGRASGDLATVFSQLGDFSVAEAEADRAVTLLKRTRDYSLIARALFVQADVLGRDRGLNPEIEKLYHQAASVARQAGDQRLECLILDDLGISLLDEGRIHQAEEAIGRAYLLCTKANAADDLPVIQEHLAELHLAQKNYPAALKFIDAAFASSSPLFKINPQYYPLHVRGEILLGLGRTDAALAEFRRAVRSADEWRQGALPGDITATQTVVLLNSTYRDFAELAATLALKRRDPSFSREAFEALARNRAASLREQLLSNFSRSGALSSRYLDLLSQLQTVQQRITLLKSAQDEAKRNEILAELDALENDMALQSSNLSSVLENNSHKNSLRNIQLNLSRNEALLSFCLGKVHSFLWAITGDQVNLYELPPPPAIEMLASTFARSVRDGKAGGAAGLDLSSNLFGCLPSKISQKSAWLIVPDGILLDAFPFSALPVPQAGGHAPFLADVHAIRLLPSEFLLASRPAASPANGFVGVADPIYNQADSRLPRTDRSAARLSAVALARLPGSEREIHASAGASGIAGPIFLTGINATASSLRRALLHPPQILHFAVHVVSPEGHPEEAALALSLGPNHVPELLTPETVASFRVPGTLVIMSGCASEQGRILPSAGLIGLARAWLLAGAAGVIVSAWPTPDDSGQFFASFYRHLETGAPASGSLVRRAAVALAQAQAQMQSAGGYRSAPSFWAAYSLISKE
jgi:CHAT domain-containing protein